MLTIEEFQRNRKKRLSLPPAFITGLHPTKTGIGKKETSFYPHFIHVRFNRKTLPKSGKSIVNGCFVEIKGFYALIWDIKTRALLTLCSVDLIEEKTKEFK